MVTKKGRVLIYELNIERQMDDSHLIEGALSDTPLNDSSFNQTLEEA